MTNTTDERVLFLQTPRAGEWNHRYIIPDNCPGLNDSHLGKCREIIELTGEVSGIKITAPAQQVGGRVGEEILFFYCPNYNSLPQSVQRSVRNQLQNWFDNQRAPLINRINWETEGQTMTIPRKELTELFTNVCRIAGPVKPTTDATNTIATKTKMRIFLTGVIMSIIAVLLIVFATGTPGEQKDESGKGLLEYLSQIGINLDFLPKSNEKKDDDKTIINRQNNIDCLYKNHTVFFENLIPDDNKESTEKKKEATPKDFEATLKEAFDDIYQAYGDSSKDSLDDYIDLSKVNLNQKKQDPRQLIKDINQNVQNVRVLDIGYPQTKDTDWDVLKDIDPVVFHKAIGALVVLNDKKDIFSGNKILDGLDEVAKETFQILPEKEKIDSIIKLGPKFYINTNKYSDYQLAHELEIFYRKALLNNTKNDDIINSNLSMLMTHATDPINKNHLKKELPKDIEEAINTLFPTRQDAANNPGGVDPRTPL